MGARARAQYTSGLSGVESLADDRALRRLGVLLDATVRTNYYRNGGRTPTRTSGGAPYVSFKFESAALETMSFLDSFTLADIAEMAGGRTPWPTLEET